MALMRCSRCAGRSGTFEAVSRAPPRWAAGERLEAGDQWILASLLLDDAEVRAATPTGWRIADHAAERDLSHRVSQVAFERGDIERLLRLLDDRMQALPTARKVDQRRTVDIDAVVSDQVVLEEARLLAADEGIPRNWLNENAKPWTPPRPAAAIARPEKVGLTIHWHRQSICWR